MVVPAVTVTPDAPVIVCPTTTTPDVTEVTVSVVPDIYPRRTAPVLTTTVLTVVPDGMPVPEIV